MRRSEAEYDALCDELEAHWDNQGSIEFRAGVDRLREMAENGHLDAAEHLAGILTLPGPLHDAETAYKLYYVALSEQGYTVEFADRNGTPPYYCGPDGDFRNEAMVSDLVVELGFERVHELDREAAQWLASRKEQT